MNLSIIAKALSICCCICREEKWTFLLSSLIFLSLSPSFSLSFSFFVHLYSLRLHTNAETATEPHMRMTRNNLLSFYTRKKKIYEREIDAYEMLLTIFNYFFHSSFAIYNNESTPIFAYIFPKYRRMEMN